MSLTLSPDIIKKIQQDFNEQSHLVFDLLQDSIYLLGTESFRVTRSILYLSDGNLESLKSFVQVAIQDYRDLLYWAEYDKDKHARNFNKPFE